ncbi:MAG TPA: Gfo/Idh/MocA family oxidoreductase [Polyangiaceae bacterium]|jgi:predicted dehydrogenase|nr:Gfo/Idh/MocA family oxidoreductase [Polyangiaceae bacterium]
MSRKVALGLIGCGSRLRGLAKPLLQKLPDARVVALSDPNPESIRAARERLGPDARVYEDYRELCQSAEVDWVMVGSWNAFHAEHVVAALAAGKHVFCEKPLATRIDDCVAMREAVERSGRIFSFGLTLRYASLYRRIRQLLEQGAIGTLISLEFNENLGFNHGGFIHMDWRRHTRYAGSHVLEKCCHDIDLCNWFAGSLVSRAASFGGLSFFRPENAHHMARIGPDESGGQAYCTWLRNPTPPYAPHPFTDDKDVVDNQVALLEYRNGVRAMFHTNCNVALPERRMLLCGSEGTIRADLISGTIEHRRIGWDEPSTVYHDAGGGHGDGDRYLVDSLAASMFDGKPPSAGIREALASAVTCFGIDQALESGQVVSLTPLWREVSLE